MDKIKVFIADDSIIARGMLSRLISTEEDMEVVGEAGSGQGAIIMIDELDPDVIMLEANITGGMSISTVVTEIKKINANVKIIICAEASTREEVIAASLMGSDDFVNKPYRKNNLLRIIRSVVNKSDEFLS